jgi:hypothetical protein
MAFLGYQQIFQSSLNTLAAMAVIYTPIAGEDEEKPEPMINNVLTSINISTRTSIL